jgi:hypothetical protein
MAARGISNQWKMQKRGHTKKGYRQNIRTHKPKTNKKKIKKKLNFPTMSTMVGLTITRM